jgi:acyl-CoA reductase-like NAD-dependent aldehyde dehydrogenase
MKSEVEKLKCGNPWDDGVNITPIEPSSVEYMTQLVDDATAVAGAKVINNNGGTTVGNLFTPALMYPVTTQCRVANEEQFGPVVPIIPFNDKSEVVEWMKDSPFAQQASIFTTNKAEHADLINAAASIYSRINLNKQCQRGPDNLPFTGTRDSGMGVLSIEGALLEFSRPVIIEE